jgi:hypothetical protein
MREGIWPSNDKKSNIVWGGEKKTRVGCEIQDFRDLK